MKLCGEITSYIIINSQEIAAESVTLVFIPLQQYLPLILKSTSLFSEHPRVSDKSAGNLGRGPERAQQGRSKCVGNSKEDELSEHYDAPICSGS